MAHRDTYNPRKTYVTHLVYFYNTPNNRLVMEDTVKGWRRTSAAGNYGVDITNWTTKKAGSYTACTSGLYTHLYTYGCINSITISGKTYKAGPDDNIYMNFRGGYYYILYGLSCASNHKINNMHLNIEDAQWASIRMFSSNSATANTVTFRSDEFTGNIYNTSSNSLTVTNELKVHLLGDGTRALSSYYAGGTYESATGGDFRKVSGKQTYVIDGQRISNFYGGGAQVATLNTGDIHVILNKGSITNLYGGGLGGFVR